ncbi:hypothetical protein C8R44DRAFT_725951 [Mycena epipterygia]|nr:hypothetical protein C8R44DRAFT_725951 [Mycena epipterygia]
MEIETEIRSQCVGADEEGWDLICSARSYQRAAREVRNEDGVTTGTQGGRAAGIAMAYRSDAIRMRRRTGGRTDATATSRCAEFESGEDGKRNPVKHLHCKGKEESNEDIATKSPPTLPGGLESKEVGKPASYVRGRNGVCIVYSRDSTNTWLRRECESTSREGSRGQLTSIAPDSGRRMARARPWRQSGICEGARERRKQKREVDIEGITALRVHDENNWLCIPAGNVRGIKRDFPRADDALWRCRRLTPEFKARSTSLSTASILTSLGDGRCGVAVTTMEVEEKKTTEDDRGMISSCLACRHDAEVHA